MAMLPEDELVSTTDIAAIAGVERSTVSNWKRRHEDFPMPAGRNSRGPLYARQDVADWLSTRSGLSGLSGSASVRPEFSMLFMYADQYRGQLSFQDFALMALRVALGIDTEPPEDRNDLADVRYGLRDEIGALLKQPGMTRESIVREILLVIGRGSDIEPHLTPQFLIDLMVGLLGPRESVLDPACGFGGLLVSYAKEGSIVAGQELSPDLAELANARLNDIALRSGATVRIEHADSLSEDRFPELFDGVISAPPFGQRLQKDSLSRADARWSHGFPGPHAESAWIQHALAHLAPGGRAVLLMSAGVVSSLRLADLRAGLIRSGELRAVIQLPPKTLMGSNLLNVLLIIERPLQPVLEPKVLLADPTDPLPTWDKPWSEQEDQVETLMIEALLEDGPPAPMQFGYTFVGLSDVADNDFDVLPQRYLAHTDIQIRQLGDIQADSDGLLAKTEPLLAILSEQTSEVGNMFPRSTVRADRVRLGDLVTSASRGIPLHRLAKQGSFGVYGPADLQQDREPTRFLADDAPELQTLAPSYNALPGDILVSLDFRVGDVYLVTEEMFVTSGFMILRLEGQEFSDDSLAMSEPITADFLAAWLRSSGVQESLKNLSTATGPPRVSQKDLLNLEVPLATVDSQKLISDLDEKLAAAIKAVAELHLAVTSLRQLGAEATYSMFGDRS